MAKIKWHGDRVTGAVKRELDGRVDRACQLVQREIIGLLRGARSGRRYYVPNTKSKYTASAPGEPPAWRTGQLANSIDYEKKTEKNKIRGFVGTTIKEKWPYWLEVGTPGGQVSPRPYLRPGLHKNEGQIKRILGAR